MATATLQPVEPPVPTGAVLFAPPKRGGLQLQRASTAFPGCGHTVWSLSGSPAPLPCHAAAQARAGPAVLLRTCSAPSSAVVFPLRSGGGGRAAASAAAAAAVAVAPPSGAAAAAPASGTAVSRGVEGLEEFLRSRGLEAHTRTVEAWCRETGAAFLEEVLENREELAVALGLGGAERDRLLGETPETAEAGGEERAEDLQQNFLAEYGQRIRSELPGTTLEPAGIAGHVSQRFLEKCDNDTTIQAAYHGTRQSNYNSIFQKGLVVPGNEGVHVAHGSAHGVGVYTATLGNSWLSRGFADSDSFLVCAVADNNTGWSRSSGSSQQPQAAAKPSVQPPRSSGVRNVRYHKSHNKPAQALSGGQQMIGNQVLHGETPDVRHVGGAMVVFDSARVAPLFVARGIGKRDLHTTPGPYTSRAALWPAAGSPNMQQKGQLPGGGLHSGSRQASVGGEKLWLQPQELRHTQAIHLRRRTTAKARDVDRRAQRDAKEEAASK